jgi:hypothetical protein
MKKLEAPTNMNFVIKHKERERSYLITTDVIPYFYDWDNSYCEAIGNNPNICNVYYYNSFSVKNVYNYGVDVYRAFVGWVDLIKYSEGTLKLKRFDKNGNDLYITNEYIYKYFSTKTPHIYIRAVYDENDFTEQFDKLATMNTNIVLLTDILNIYNITGDYRERWECLDELYKNENFESKKHKETGIKELGITVYRLLTLYVMYGIFACKLEWIENILSYDITLSQYSIGGILTSLSNTIHHPIYLLTQSYDESKTDDVIDHTYVLNINDEENRCINNTISQNRVLEHEKNSILYAKLVTNTKENVCASKMIKKIHSLTREF